MTTHKEYLRAFTRGLASENFSRNERRNWIETSGGLEFYIAREELKKTVRPGIHAIGAATTSALFYIPVSNNYDKILTSPASANIIGYCLGPAILLGGVAVKLTLESLLPQVPKAIWYIAKFGAKSIANSDSPKKEDDSYLPSF